MDDKKLTWFFIWSITVNLVLTTINVILYRSIL